MTDKREERFRVVPIARDERIAQDIDGEQYYRQRGETVIQEAEIVSEVPFESDTGSTVIPKSDDVQQAEYQVENPPQEEEVYYDAPQSYDAADDYGTYDDEDFVQDQPMRRNTRAASRPAAKPWYKRGWIYLLLVFVLAATGGVFYIRSENNYNTRLAQIEKNVAEILNQMQQGDTTQGATLEDQIAFYSEQCSLAREQDSAFVSLNRSYWWLFDHAEAQDIGLAELNAQTENLTPLLNNLGVFMEQVDQVVSQVKGTPENPGHLLTSLDLNQAQDILQNDRNMIANALILCDELEDLPEAFRRGKENLQRELEVLDAEVVLMQAYISELKPIETEVGNFCAAARDFYARPFNDQFAEDLQAHYNVITRSDTIQQNIQSINEQTRFANVPHYYGITDFELDEAGLRILAEEGVVQTARNIVLNVRSADEKLAGNSTDRDFCLQEIENNANYMEELRALALPQEYNVGVERYIEALDARALYLDAHLDYVDAMQNVHQKQDELEALRNRSQTLRVDIAEALKNNDMRTLREKTAELEDVLNDIDDKQAEYNRVNAAVGPLLQEENRLFDSYISLVS